MKSSAFLLILFTPLCLGGEEERCEVGGTPVVTGSFKPLGRCSSGHIGEALHLGEGCEPRPTVLRLPWPQNSSHIDQVRLQFPDASSAIVLLYSNQLFLMLKI